MDCKKAGEIMMAYLDAPLSLNSRNAEQFHKHLTKCTACREDFNAYNDIVTSLLIGEPEEPPLDFEACVMEKITAANTFATESKAPKKDIGRLEYISIVLWSVASVLLGIYFMFLINSDAPALMSQSENIQQQLDYLFSVVSELINRYQYVLILGASGLLFAQAQIKNRVYGKPRG